MTARIASLPMYEVDRDAVQAWWHAIASQLQDTLDDLPAQLTWPAELETHWRDEHLLLSQCCGYPLVHVLAGSVQVVGAFRYAAPGCSGIDYRSVFVVREQERGVSIASFQGRRLAINGRDSYSGWHAPMAFVSPLSPDQSFFRSVVETGSHRNALAALRQRKADVAAIDCVTLELLRRHRPGELFGLKTVGTTSPAPGLPLITSISTPPGVLDLLRSALRAVCADPGLASLRQALLIEGFELPAQDEWQQRIGRGYVAYESVPPPASMKRAG